MVQTPLLNKRQHIFFDLTPEYKVQTIKRSAPTPFTRYESPVKRYEPFVLLQLLKNVLNRPLLLAECLSFLSAEEKNVPFREALNK